jgi:predicted MFS family arabinose efflux permease
VIITIPFLQYFSTIPLFYNEVHGMSEASIGLLIAFNGLLIFLTEMPLIKWCERQGYSIYSILVASVLFFIVSFVLLEIAPVVAVLWVGMTFMTIGEMLNFPFMNRVAMDRSDHGLPGAYMAMFTISWSVAHIIGHNLGMHMVEALGYTKTWYVFMIMLCLGVVMLYVYRAMVKRENEKERSEHAPAETEVM